MLPFYLVPDLKFDIIQAQKYYDSVKDQDWNMKYGEDANIHMWEIDNTVPFMAEFLNTLENPHWIVKSEFFRVPANSLLPGHIDNGRKVAINIPIVGFFDQTSLDTYDVSHLVNDDTVDRSGAKGFDGKGKLISRVYYNVPVLVNTSIPHGTTNNTDQDRVIVSISYSDKVNIGILIRSMLANEFYKR